MTSAVQGLSWHKCEGNEPTQEQLQKTDLFVYWGGGVFVRAGVLENASSTYSGAVGYVCGRGGGLMRSNKD